MPEVSVSPAGEVWLGRSCVSDSVVGDWRNGPLELRDTTAKPSVRPIVDRISFFDADTAIATGYVTHGDDLERGYLYRTTDGGRSWDSVAIGAGVWIYDVFVGRTGSAWTGGSDGAFYHTRDGAVLVREEADGLSHVA